MKTQLKKAISSSVKDMKSKGSILDLPRIQRFIKEVWLLEVLTSNSLCDAMLRCGEHGNYKVVIAFARRLEAYRFAKELADYHSETPIEGVKSVFVSARGNSKINFTNGSRIDVVTVSDRNRGIRCNEVIYDDAIEGEASFCILRGMLVPYKCGDTEEVNISNTEIEEINKSSESLDEFLNSFTIV